MSATPTHAHHNTSAHTAHTAEDGDINMVSMWLEVKPQRLIAGAMGGFVAGLVALAFAMLLSALAGYEVWYAAKIPAIPLMGPDAMTLGFQLPALLIGVATHSVLSMVLGMVYAHFTVTNSLLPLLGAGFVWGTFSWIFIFNLFVQSFPAINALQLSRACAFFVCLSFGFSLVSVRFFDRSKA